MNTPTLETGRLIFPARISFIIFSKPGRLVSLPEKPLSVYSMQASPWVSYLQYASWLSTDMLSFFSIDCLAYNASYIGIFVEDLIELCPDFLPGFLF